MSLYEKEIRLERGGWFIRLRWGAVAGASVLLLAGPWVAPFRVEYGKIGACVLVLGLLNLSYHLLWKKWKSHPAPSPRLSRMAGYSLHFQMSADLVLLTAMLFFSGGARNPLLLFYLFHIAISAILFSVPESLAYAALAVALPWLLDGLQSLGIVGENPWTGLVGLSADREQALLLAYSATVAGLWFFLSRLSSDLEAGAAQLRETGEKLKAANEALRHLDLFKNRFLRQVVLQLKNPAIEMDFDLSTVIRTLPPGNEEVLPAVQKAKKRIGVLLELIEDLTWLSRMEAEEAPLRKEPMDVYEALLSRIQAWEERARQKGITFQLHGDPQVRILAEPESFARAVDHLLSNAVKYTPAGENTVRVDFQPEGNWLQLCVEDHGIGIPPKQQKKLFQEFFRASNAKAMEKLGTGLGLFTVKQVMERHGGKVKIASGPEKGTKVETWWPFMPGL